MTACVTGEISETLKISPRSLRHLYDNTGEIFVREDDSNVPSLPQTFAALRHARLTNVVCGKED